MSTAKMIYLGVAVSLVAVVYVAWKAMSRDAYESAEYTVLETDGRFELRKYPELTLATTDMRFESQGDDGSFMRLVRYISGDNEGRQKIAMTTPVFMDPDSPGKPGIMAFVMPAKVSGKKTPSPSSDKVEIRKRRGGRFAVVRFSGRINARMFAQAERDLRNWIADRGLKAESNAEIAGYDPPWTPGFMRRNEVLIRLK